MSRIEANARVDSPPTGSSPERGYLRGGVLAASALLCVAVVIGSTTTPDAARAAFPGENGRIACEGLRGMTGPGLSGAEIFSVNPDAGDERRLTDNTTRDGDPAFSPDGTRILFEGRRVVGQPDNSEIYVADNDGDLDGPDLVRLTFNNGLLSNGTRNQVAATDRSPSWSNDGTQIVFHSGREVTFNDGGTTPVRDFEIYKMSAALPETEQPAQRLTESRGQDAIPSWSPDGTKIAFQSQREAGANFFNLEIFTINPDGSGATNISNNPGTPDDPATEESESSDAIDSFATGWSPDGTQIAFGSTRDNVTPGNQNFEIYKVNRDGSNPTRLTLNLTGDTPDTSKDYDQAPTWSPDGKRILFTSGRTSTADQDRFVAYTTNADTGEATGLQAVGSTDIFARCDWQSVDPPTAVPPFGPPPPRSPAPERVQANLVRPKVTARQRGNRVRIQIAGLLTNVRGRTCAGKVTLGVRSGGKRKARRTVRVDTRCRYATSASFGLGSLPRRLRSRDARLLVKVSTVYRGTSELLPDRPPTVLRRVIR